jgi:Ino eighty subunit 2
MDTINRLLKKQPPKRGRRTLQEITGSDEEDEPRIEKANPLYVRYIQNEKGTQVGVPEEWLEAAAGGPFTAELTKSSGRPFGGRMVEEVA